MDAGELITKLDGRYRQLINRNDLLTCLLDLNSPDVAGLSSPPIVYRRVMELLGDLEANRAEIAEIVSYDPTLMSRVLKAANHHAAAQKIDDIHAALSAVNDEDLRTLVTTATAIDSFSYVDTDLVDMNDFWSHSVCCGLVARVLAERCGHASPNQVYIAGVLHDIGQLVIYHALPELANEVLGQASELESYRYRAEKEVIGTTHAEVGAELMKSWGLPEYLQEVARFHHEPAKATRYAVETALVHISTGVANRIEPSWKMGLAQRESVAQINHHAWRVTGLSPTACSSITSHTVMSSSSPPW